MKRILALVLSLMLLAGIPALSVAEEKSSLWFDEPLHVKAWMIDVNNDNFKNDDPIWQYIAEKTNVHFDIEFFTTTQAEAYTLRLATLEDLPDMAFRTDLDRGLMADAVEGGFMVELTDDLLKEYAPTWYAFLQANPISDKLHRGYRVGLPNVDYVEYVGNMRDLLQINKVWLDELNLEVPTTIDEFTAVLQAFKDNAGKGSIPAEAIPFYYQWNHRISGMFDVLGFWGITVTNTHWLAVKDGEVVFQGANPAIKEPIKYLAKLYELGLTPPESFTDDRSMSQARTGSAEPYIGFVTGFNNFKPDYYIPMAPVVADENIQPVIRKQEFTYTGTEDFVIFNDELKEELLQLADWMITDHEFVANSQLGMKGFYWDYDENGMITPFTTEQKEAKKLEVGEEEMGRQAALGNMICSVRADAFYANYNDIAYEDPSHRAWAYRNVYAPDYIPVGETNYRDASTGDADLDQRRKDLKVEIDNLRSTTLTRWITGQGDIDAEWDAYVAQLNALGLEEYLELCQMGYDTLGLN